MGSYATWKRLALIVAGFALLTPSTASALRPQYRNFAPSRTMEVRCDQLSTVTVTHPKSRRPAKVGNSFGWHVDSSVTNGHGIPVAIIVAIERVRDANGDLGIRWTLKGAYEACTDPASQHRIDWSFGILIKKAKVEFSDCGTVRAVNGTRAFVEANGYTPTCRKARSVASAWSRYQNADNGIHPMLKFSRPSRIRGFRCSGAKLGGLDSPSRVKCRRGRARVKWWW